MNEAAPRQALALVRDDVVTLPIDANVPGWRNGWRASGLL
jgi:hypothetical protein